MAEHEESLASFMSITGAEPSTALQYLEVNLFMETGGRLDGSAAPPPAPAAAAAAAASTSAYEDPYADIRAPDPSKRQRLVGDVPDIPLRRLHEQYRDFAAESIAAINRATQEDAISPAFAGFEPPRAARDLGSLFQPPVEIMFKGSYSEARALAKNDSKWLLVNVLDEIVFASHMLNRDTWSDDTVQNVVASSFVFWQTYWASDHGRKFCALYQIDRELLPVIAIVDPKSGEIVHQWTGFMEPSDMTEKLSDFAFTHAMDESSEAATAIEPRNEDVVDMSDASEEEQLRRAIEESMRGASEEAQETKDEEDTEEEEKEEEEEEEVPVLPDEPADGSSDVTRVQIRTPDGSRLTRRFLKSDPIAFFWLFIKQQIPEARRRPFEVRTAFPPAQVAFSESETIAERKLENASLMVKWSS
ncbi:hypothetical protein P43SY_001879 [Pythium insidiosum]|uniref:UBX domain-containing protein n=1 Tax=Pythium insidiosum TaxID=114742 RepID=A0AAD5Q5K9_PYTIN|nr:hypothetical protein P43SY_001879 [Pythium insidiosum]